MMMCTVYARRCLSALLAHLRFTERSHRLLYPIKQIFKASRHAVYLPIVSIVHFN